MHTLIASVLSKLSNGGLAPRAQSLFEQVMKRGQLRWGRKAKLAAGASIVVALREAHRSDSIRDIAVSPILTSDFPIPVLNSAHMHQYLLEEPPLAISRSFSSVVRILQLQLALADPSSHLSVLQEHLHTLILKPSSGSSSSLPVQLSSALLPLMPKFPGILHTATMLSSLVTRIGSLTNLPTPPTACAIFILAIEGELSTSLPNVGVMAQCLGSRMGVSKKVVMERYKITYDAIEEWMREVPWLEAHGCRGSKKGGSKVAKRVIVARGLKDVVQFQDEIWHKKLAGVEKPVLTPDADDGMKGVDKEEGDLILEVDCPGGALDSPIQPDSREDVCTLRTPQVPKRQTPYQRSIVKVSQFLLQPLLGSPSTASRSRDGTPSDEDELIHLLTADVSALTHTFFQPPSRLQKLVVSRAGGEEGIPDEELFEHGELEGFLRTDDEVQALKATFDWAGSHTGKQLASDSSIKKRKRQQSHPEDDTSTSPSVKRTKRVNLDILASLLDPMNNLYEDDAQDEHCVSVDTMPSVETSEIGSVYRDDDDDDDDNDEGNNGDEEFGLCGIGEDGEVVEEWRPLSPEGVGFDEDRYEF